MLSVAEMLTAAPHALWGRPSLQLQGFGETRLCSQWGRASASQGAQVTLVRTTSKRPHAENICNPCLGFIGMIWGDTSERDPVVPASA